MQQNNIYTASQMMHFPVDVQSDAAKVVASTGGNTMATIFANKSNAIRGFRQHFASIAASMSNDAIRMDFLNVEADGRVSINLEAVADYQQDRLGVVSHNQLVGVPMLRRSMSGGAVALSHQLFAKLPAGTPRKDAIALAVGHGIAFYTARTQYQRWAKAA
jgi:hypothetical protein